MSARTSDSLGRPKDEHDPGSNDAVIDVSPTEQCTGSPKKPREFKDFFKKATLFSGPTVAIDDFSNTAEGLPRLAAFMNRDLNYAIYRRLGHLRNQILLHRQHELSMLEQKLTKMNASAPEGGESSDPNPEIPAERTKLVDIIEQNLEKYDKLIEQESRMLQKEKPTARNQIRYLTYVCDSKPVNDAAMGFIHHADDLIALTSRKQDTWTAATFKNIAHFAGSKELFTLRPHQLAERYPDVLYYTHSKMRTVVRFVITIGSLAFLLTPVVLLSLVRIGVGRTMLIVAGSQLLFASVIAGFTRARPHEIFGVTLAYFAILSVFLSNRQTGW